MRERGVVWEDLRLRVGGKVNTVDIMRVNEWGERAIGEDEGEHQGGPVPDLQAIAKEVAATPNQAGPLVSKHLFYVGSRYSAIVVNS